MYKQLILILTITVFPVYLSGQQVIDVTENTFKIKGFGEEVLYYGFAEGDQLIFNFQEINKKELKEIEITELPSSSKFMDYKTKKIENKILHIGKTGIYKFRFTNSAIMGRICKIKIQRVPSSEATQNFNSSVYWRTVYDTTYTIEKEKYLVSSDTSIVNITDQVAKVHSGSNLNGNKTTFNFTLPENTIAWSYYIGVDQAGQQAYEKATKELNSNTTLLISKIPGYGPTAALALNAISYLTKLQSGEDIDFYIVDGLNVNPFLSGQEFRYIKKGKVINDFSRMAWPLRGMYHMCLSNDNAVVGVNVTVKITSIGVTNVWDIKPVQKMYIASCEEAYLKN